MSVYCFVKRRKYLLEHTFQRVWRVASGAEQTIPTNIVSMKGTIPPSKNEDSTFWCFFGPLPILFYCLKMTAEDESRYW